MIVTNNCWNSWKRCPDPNDKLLPTVCKMVHRWNICEGENSATYANKDIDEQCICKQ